ncbi:SprB repeat-containing protein, partial [Bacteroidales bacterium OttesenSCG-928-J16]|nr:SprB repeat-containing protein [Bacteroidales bacterium OttesenSCG-928-J16]
GKVSGLTSGVYVVDVKDADDCVVSFGEVTIGTTNPGLAVTTSGTTNTDCGLAIGAFTLTATTGTAPYTWQLNGGVTTTGANTITYSGLTAGNYSWSVTDVEGCYGDGRQTISNTTVPTFAVTATPTDASCDGLSGGTITLAITGGTTPFEYSIDNGTTYKAIPTGNVISDLAVGTYNVIVKDASDCTYEYADITIGRRATNDLNMAEISVVSNPTCSNATGSIHVLITGGSGDYQYKLNTETSYSNLASDGSINGLAAGTYYISVQDRNAAACGTIVSPAITLTPQDTDLTLSVMVTEATACGTADGSLTIAVTGGAPTYTYTLDGQAITLGAGGVIGGLVPKTYIVQVTDDEGCKVSKEVKLGSATGLDVTPSVIVDTDCGQSLGSFTLTISNGTAPYTWQLNNGPIITTVTGDITFSNLSAGQHYWNVVDGNNCKAEAYQEIKSTEDVSYKVDLTVTNAACDGLGGGEVVFTITGGTSPYKYSRDNGDNWIDLAGATGKMTNLSIGTYSLMIRDANDCDYQYSNITIERDSEGGDLSIKGISVLDQPTCSYNTGSISLRVIGGSGSYQYALSQEGPYTDLPANNTISGLRSGTYRVYVQDKLAPLCGVAESAAVTLQPTNADMSLRVATSNASSCGVNNGWISVVVDGGVAPYRYFLNGVAPTTMNGNYIEYLKPGIYVVDVEDGTGCLISSGEIEIEATDGGLDVTLESITNATCDSAIGSVTLSVAGGTAPYVWKWNTGIIRMEVSNTITFNNLPAGNHEWTVTDATGCYANGRQEIAADDNPTFSVTATATNALCDGLDGGSITLIATGGLLPYQYSMDEGLTWNAFASGNKTIIENLAVGTHTVIVKDLGDCEFAYEVLEIKYLQRLAPPSVTTPQTFCSGATIANLKANGVGIRWYTAPIG